jgi:hypothetical protein
MFANRSCFQCSASIALLIVSTALLGSDPASAKSGPSREKAPKGGARLEIPKPEIGPGMPAPDRWAFNAAFNTAVKRVHGRRSCGDLFEGLNLRGVEALGGTRYQRAWTPADRALCQGGVSAVTSIHGRETRLCYHFKVLSQNDKAAILIHEALHAAGLTERPHDPEAPTSREITAMVKGACAL